MAVAVAQAKHATADASSATIAVTVTSTGAAGCIVGQVTWFGSATTDLTSVTDNKSGGSNTYVIKNATAFAGIAGLFAAQFIATNTGAGVTSVTCHFSPNAQFRRAFVQELTGADTTSPYNASTGQSQTNPGTGSNAVTSGSFTSTVNNCLIIGATFNGTTSGIPTAGTGFSSNDTLNNTSDGDSQAVESKTLGTAGSTAVTFTSSAGASANFVTLGMAIAPAVAAAPTVTDVNSGDVIKAGDTGDTMTGTNLGTTTSDRTFELVQGTTAVTQTQTAGNSTSGTFTVVTEPGGAAIKFGTTTFRVTRTSDSAQGTRAITVNPATGQLYVDLTAVNASSAYRITASGDLSVGDQLHARGVGGGSAPTGLSLGADGTFSFSAGNTPASFDVRVWSTADSTWGAFATQTIGAATITPPAGSLTLTGQVPTVTATANTVITPPAGSLTLTGQVPTVTTTANQFILPPAGNLSLTGLAPTVNAGSNATITPPAGSLTLTGNVPTVALSNNQTVSPPAGSLSLTGLAPTIATTQNVLIDVPVAQLSFSALVPQIQGVVIAETFSGGFLYEYELHSKARGRRKREQEEAAVQAAQELQEARDREIAAFLHAQEQADAEREDAERLRQLALKYAKEQHSAELADRVKQAYVRVLAQGNYSAIEALRRELDRALEEEEFAVLMILLEE